MKKQDGFVMQKKIMEYMFRKEGVSSAIPMPFVGIVWGMSVFLKC